MDSGTTVSLQGVWGKNGDVFVVGENGTILRYEQSVSTEESTWGSVKALYSSDPKE